MMTVFEALMEITTLVKFSATHAPKPIDADALAELQRMPWSGNIRELRNVIERLIILSGDRITARDVKEYC